MINRNSKGQEQSSQNKTPDKQSVPTQKWLPSISPKSPNPDHAKDPKTQNVKGKMWKNNISLKSKKHEFRSKGNRNKKNKIMYREVKPDQKTIQKKVSSKDEICKKTLHNQLRSTPLNNAPKSYKDFSTLAVNSDNIQTNITKPSKICKDKPVNINMPKNENFYTPEKMEPVSGNKFEKSHSDESHFFLLIKNLGSNIDESEIKNLLESKFGKFQNKIVKNSNNVYIKFGWLEQIQEIIKINEQNPLMYGSKKAKMCLVNKLPLDLNQKSKIGKYLFGFNFLVLLLKRDLIRNIFFNIFIFSYYYTFSIIKLIF